MAYNEEANIGRLLKAVLSQKLKTVAITEIVVVASGCTDSTESIVREWTKRDPRIRLSEQRFFCGRRPLGEFLALFNCPQLPGRKARMLLGRQVRPADH